MSVRPRHEVLRSPLLLDALPVAGDRKPVRGAGASAVRPRSSEQVQQLSPMLMRAQLEQGVAAEQAAEVQRALEQQLRMYKTLASISDYAYSFDREGRFLFANQSLLDLLGLSLGEVVGKTFFELPYPGELAARLQGQIAQVFATGKKLTDETEYSAPGGPVRYYEYIFNPVFAADGTVEIVAGSTRDVTERCRAQAAALRSEKLATAGRLAATLAHEINNPLQAVMNLLTVLQHSPRLNAEDRAYATMAEEELSRVAHLTHQSLSFYRKSVPHALAAAEPVVVEELVEAIALMYAGKLQAKQVALTTQYGSGRSVIFSHAEELGQVLSSLLMNAMEAGGRGGRVVMRVQRSRDPRAGVEGVRIVIADDGFGIPAENVARLSEAFFTTKGQHRTGMGLWVAHGILGRIGGTIRMRSSVSGERRGSCFSVFLPRRME